MRVKVWFLYSSFLCGGIMKTTRAELLHVIGKQTPTSVLMKHFKLDASNATHRSTLYHSLNKLIADNLIKKYKLGRSCTWDITDAGKTALKSPLVEKITQKPVTTVTRKAAEVKVKETKGKADIKAKAVEKHVLPKIEKKADKVKEKAKPAKAAKEVVKAASKKEPVKAAKEVVKEKNAKATKKAKGLRKLSLKRK
jgi:DNA-binding PadR family transcriptional regulator